MRNNGLHQYRFESNPLEKKFAEEWEKQNTTYTGSLISVGTLDYLLAKNNNRPRGEVTDRDREVAATVIQWLGSPVGRGFLRDIETLTTDNE